MDDELLPDEFFLTDELAEAEQDDERLIQASDDEITALLSWLSDAEGEVE